MALAKYHEEIGERWIANNDERFEASIAGLFDFLPRRTQPAGEAYLSRNGRRMEDLEVCDLGEKLEVCLESVPGAAPGELELLDDSGICTVRAKANQKFTISFRSTGLVTLQVRSAGFLKNYRIEAIESEAMTRIPALTKLIQSLSDHLQEWTPEGFGRFRSELEKVLVSCPRTLSEGIVEYHMALFLEEQRSPDFRQRLESAYGHLRWFVPSCDIARLICSYYLFCANEFDAAETLWKRRSGRMRQMIAFFTGRMPEEAASYGVNTSESLAFLVSMPDLLLFQAIEALHQQRAGDAWELIQAARRHIRADFDRERASRFAFIEARAKMALNENLSAVPLLESLLDSPWRTIGSAAARHLKSLNGNH